MILKISWLKPDNIFFFEDRTVEDLTLIVWTILIRVSCARLVIRSGSSIVEFQCLLIK